MMLAIPTNVNGRQYHIIGYTGKDLFLHLLPSNWQARLLGRRILAGLQTSVSSPNDLTFTLPNGTTYAILDNKGMVKALSGCRVAWPFTSMLTRLSHPQPE